MDILFSLNLHEQCFKKTLNIRIHEIIINITIKTLVLFGKYSMIGKYEII